MSKSTSKWLKGKTILVLLIITNAVYAVMLTWSIPHLVNLAGGLEIPDMMPLGYDATQVRDLFNALGMEGRSFYLSVQIPIDMLYPFLFGISYTLLMLWLFSRLQALHTVWVNLSFLPLLAALFDYFENISLIFLLNSYPDLGDTGIWIASVCTLIKSMLTTVYFSALVVVLITWLFKRKR